MNRAYIRYDRFSLLYPKIFSCVTCITSNISSWYNAVTFLCLSYGENDNALCLSDEGEPSSHMGRITIRWVVIMTRITINARRWGGLRFGREGNPIRQRVVHQGSRCCDTYMSFLTILHVNRRDVCIRK